MNKSDIIYFFLLGLCNFVVFRDIFSYGLGRIQISPPPQTMSAVFFGALVTLIGGIAHQAFGFDPDLNNKTIWFVGLIAPLILAFMPKSRVQ